MPKAVDVLSLTHFTCNPFEENTYVLYHATTLDAFVIDPGADNEETQKILTHFLQEKSLKLKGILLTHAHLDHVLGLSALQRAHDVPTYMHPDEEVNFKALPRYVEICGLKNYVPGKVSHPLQAGDVLMLGDTSLTVRKVPGHSPGHVVFYQEEQQLLIAGDTLFHESIGRTDLPGGDHDTLLQAIRTELYSLPDTVQVHPGHGPATSIGHEKKHNPFVSQI